MPKTDLGVKRTCPETGKKFYDLGKDPIVSPFTGKEYPVSYFEELIAKTPPKKAARPKPEPKEEVEDDEDEDEDIEDAVEADEDEDDVEDDEPELDEEPIDLGEDDEDDDVAAPAKKAKAAPVDEDLDGFSEGEADLDDEDDDDTGILLDDDDDDLDDVVVGDDDDDDDL